MVSDAPGVDETARVCFLPRTAGLTVADEGETRHLSNRTPEDRKLNSRQGVREIKRPTHQRELRLQGHGIALVPDRLMRRPGTKRC